MLTTTNLSICLLAHNRVDQIAATVEALLDQVDPNATPVFILDNGSEDGTPEILQRLKALRPSITLLQSKENLGCAGGRETLWGHTNTPFILSMDDDILIDATTMANMLALMESDENIAVVSPLIYDTLQKRVLNPVLGDPENSPFFYEGCFLLRAAAWREMGAMDPHLQDGGEGLDFSIRLRRKGYRIARAKSCQVLHLDRERPVTDRVERRKKWVFGFAYVHAKHHGIFPGLFKAGRDGLSQARAVYRDAGFRAAASLCRPWWNGFYQGCKKCKAED